MRTFIQRHIEEIKYTLGGGGIGFIGSKLWMDWVQPVLITIICAVISLLIGHFGKKFLNRKQYQERFKSNGKQ